MRPPPSPEAQLQWLNKLQRLFSEGEFTATYKFALLMALADLAVEKGTDDGEPLALTFREIAVKFIELYWQQTAPYARTLPSPALLAADSATDQALYQSNGRQAAVVSSISAFRRQHIGLGPAAIARDVDAPCRKLSRPLRALLALPARPDAQLRSRPPEL